VGNVEGYSVDHEYAVIKFEIQESQAQSRAQGTSDWRAIFFNKINLKRAVISTLPFTFQNICGVPLMFGYTTFFFQLAGVNDPFLGNLIKQMVLVVGIVLAFYTVDVVGRRTLVIGGGALLATICFIVGGLGFMEQTPASGAALVALCCIWAFVYANSLAPIGKDNG
jgi:hypothetical protein